jgi:hypothetical protein
MIEDVHFGRKEPFCVLVWVIQEDVDDKGTRYGYGPGGLSATLGVLGYQFAGAIGLWPTFPGFLFLMAKKLNLSRRSKIMVV